ncbi:TetR family transcriptional regulator [Nocardioides sp. MAHUQ-72]|uniref:TetR family transcriptional regulator n=1 Tax=unclassified Nocardioides TaxID=2615069 RepID=UPI0036147AD2
MGGPVGSASSLTVEELGSAAQRDRRKRILDATIALASQGGFDAVQMRAVAEQADVALGTLYRYFPSKIHLLVSALGREFERAEAATRDKPIPGDTPHQRVMHLLARTNKGLQADPHLTEALTRAFMFADESVKNEIQAVGTLVSTMLTRAMHPGQAELTGDDTDIARVIGDVWLSLLVGWVTGRTSADDVGRQLDVAVRLLLRD